MVTELIILVGILGVISLLTFLGMLLFFQKRIHQPSTIRSIRKEFGNEKSVTVEDEERIVRRLGVYQNAMSYEESIRVSYQSLVAALQTILFSFVFLLVQLGHTSSLWIFATAGILLCAGFAVACDFRARNVDFWRRRIAMLVKGTQLENDFKGSLYGWVPVGQFGSLGEKYLGHWFERLILPLLTIIWVGIVWGWS